MRATLICLLTGLCALVLGLALWVVAVQMLDRPLRAYSQGLWAASLWISYCLSAAFVSTRRWAVKPAIGCTVVCGAFALTYFAAEGPIFGNVSEGGDPSITESVFWNLCFLPLGVFLASDLSNRLFLHREKTHATVCAATVDALQ
jgi:hypothetical protein